MTRVALKGVLGRKVRAGLTALAIVLGVAMVSGSFVLTDTISKAFTSVFSSSYAHTDAVVSGKKLVDYSSSGNATVSQALLQTIRKLPYVEAAAGSIADMNGDSTRAKLIGHDGKAIDHNGAPTFGFGVDTSQPQFNALKLESGRWAAGPGEVVIDPDTAKNEHFGVGDTIGVAAIGPEQKFRIVGIAKYGDVESLGGATFAVFTIPEARKLMRIDGYTGIQVAAKGNLSQDELAGRLQRLLPGTAQVKTADEQANADKKGVAGFLTFIRGFLLGFGGIALFVGAFVIFNTLSITVAQRTRELATLRTLGATRRQVLRSVLLESLVLGAVASVVGLFVGFGLAKGLSALMNALGLSLPQAATVYAGRTFVVSLLLGTVVTVVSGIVPAIRATRVAPIAAARGDLPQRVRGR
jgi:putative ABC transport system permease protein